MTAVLEIMLKTTIEYLRGDTGLNRVVFCLFGLDSFAVFQKSWQSSCRRRTKKMNDVDIYKEIGSLLASSKIL